MNPSVLDVFILSLFDRGLETAYDLQRQADVSLGSSVPALRRLEKAGLAKRTAQTGSSKRLRYKFEITAAGRKLARAAWISLLKNQPQSDLDSILRLVDVARHYQAKAADVVAYLDAASSERRSLMKSGHTRFQIHNSLGIVATREAWDTSRLKAEAKFLTELAKCFGRNAPRVAKR